FLPSIAVTSRVAASLMRRPQAYISRKAILATGCRTLPTTARASASERTPGRRLRFGALIFFLRTAPSRGRARVRRGTGCRHDGAETSLARRRARRANARGSCALAPHRDHRANGDSGRQVRERRGCRQPGCSVRGRPRPCRRSYAYVGVSSWWSFSRIAPAHAGPTRLPRQPTHAPDGERHLRRSRSVQRCLCGAPHNEREMDAYAEKCEPPLPVEPEQPSPVLENSQGILELNLRDEGISSVIWATGYACDFSWIKLPLFDGNGDPIHVRGVTKRRGLFFLGLRRTYSLGSALVAGAVNDAAYIADQISALRRA